MARNQKAAPAATEVTRQPLQFIAPPAAKAPAKQAEAADGVKVASEKGKGKSYFPAELIGSLKCPQSIVDKIAGSPELQQKMEKGQLTGITLGDVLNGYSQEEQKVKKGDNGQILSSGGYAIRFEDSNLYPDADNLMRKGRPNPQLLTNKIGNDKTKTTNSEFISVDKTAKWPEELRNQQVSIEFGSKKKEDYTPEEQARATQGEIIKDTTKMSVYFRTYANTKPISAEQTKKEAEAAAGHDNYSVRSGRTVFADSLKPSHFPTFQGMGAMQYNNSAYLRANAEAAALKGNEAAKRYVNMKAGKSAAEVDAPEANVVEDTGIEMD